MSRVSAAAMALLGGGALWNKQVPTVPVNRDDSLMAAWPSEAFGAPADMAPECSFFNFTARFEATLCTHYTLGRSSSLPARAAERAGRCAAAHGAECVLSPEIGLAIPAAFLYTSSGRMMIVLGPKLLTTDDDEQPPQHVRVAPPDGDGVTDTKTFLFNRTVHAEFLDGSTRTMQTAKFEGDRAYCIQLLRAAFEPRCWSQLD